MGKVVLTGVVKYDYIGHLKVFLDSQDHLPEVHQGAGQEQGCPQRLIFGKVAVIGVVKDDHIGHLKVFLDSQNHKSWPFSLREVG